VCSGGSRIFGKGWGEWPKATRGWGVGRGCPLPTGVGLGRRKILKFSS